MPKVTYVRPDGERTSVEANDGSSVMETAVDNGVDGIVAECGGNMMCATCHVVVDDEWFARLPERDEIEDGMLDETAVPRQEHSRLSCQIKMSEDLDGLVVHLPESQV